MLTALQLAPQVSSELAKIWGGTLVCFCVMKWNSRAKSGCSGSGSGFRSKDPSEIQISSTDEDTDEGEAKMSKL